MPVSPMLESSTNNLLSPGAARERIVKDFFFSAVVGDCI